MALCLYFAIHGRGRTDWASPQARFARHFAGATLSKNCTSIDSKRKFSVLLVGEPVASLRQFEAGMPAQRVHPLRKAVSSPAPIELRNDVVAAIRDRALWIRRRSFRMV